MSEALNKAIGQVPEEAWAAYGPPHPVEIRECAEVSFVPGEKSEHKDTQPLRYAAIRIRQRQESLLADGSKVKHFAVVSNIREWKASRLIEWHREKAGTVEAVHDVLKNELAAGVMPSKYFGTNAAWLRLAAIAHNVMTALKRLALPAELLTGAAEAVAVPHLQHAGPAGASRAKDRAAFGDDGGPTDRVAGGAEAAAAPSLNPPRYPYRRICRPFFGAGAEVCLRAAFRRRRSGKNRPSRPSSKPAHPSWRYFFTVVAPSQRRPLE